MKSRFAFLIFLLLLGSVPLCAQRDYTQYVNPLVGTDFVGNTYPGAQVPFGMVQLSPDNLIGGWDRIAGYFYPDSTLTGFSHTHLSGTGAGDLYDISFFPTTLPQKADFTVRHPDQAPLGIYSTFLHSEETATAGFYAVRLADYDIRVRLTATPRCGIQHYTFPADGRERVVTLNLARTMNWDATQAGEVQFLDSTTLCGHRFSTGWARDQRVFFATRFSRPWQRVEVDTVPTTAGRSVVVRFYFGHSADEAQRSITLVTALSGTSTEGALRNLAAEAPHNDFDRYREDARRLWNEQLSRLEAESDNTTDLRKFYTALYHTLLAPTIASDVDGAYLGSDRRIHHTVGIHYSTFSLWDTFRASHPLFTLICPERVGDMAQSLIDFGTQHDRLPVWSMWSCETDMMIGLHAIPILTDAIGKGIKGFDYAQALALSRRSLLDADYRSLGHYDSLGYVPFDVTDMGKDDWSLSRTLEYAYNDHCVAQMAQWVEGRPDHRFAQRSQNFRYLFDAQSGFFRPRDSHGRFQSDFHPEAYTPHICESNAWQYLWSVQHDLPALMHLLGGRDRMEARLDSFFTLAPRDKAELPLFSTGMLGQYAHGNEPSHHVAYLYNVVGRPEKTQHYVARIVRELYRDNPAGLCGNDDCGQLSAWLVWSAMGFYPVDPVSGRYELGTPLFPRLRLHLPGGTTTTLLAPHVDADHWRVASLRVNGRRHRSTFLPHALLTSGARMEWEMK